MTNETPALVEVELANLEVQLLVSELQFLARKQEKTTSQQMNIMELTFIGLQNTSILVALLLLTTHRLAQLPIQRLHLVVQLVDERMVVVVM